MVLADDRILEYIRENGAASPTPMADSGYVRYSSQYIGQRCQKLAKHGLLQHLGNGVYVITDRGEAYLDGELDTSEDSQDRPPEVDEGPTASGESEEPGGTG
jgi:predicted transcriptional regulator